MDDDDERLLAAAALGRWFNSQNIDTAESILVMAELIAFALATDAKDARDLKFKREIVEDILTAGTLDWAEKLRQRPLAK